MNKSLWYDEYQQKVLPIDDNIESARCPYCKGKRPVVRRKLSITCSDCRTLLYTR